MTSAFATKRRLLMSRHPASPHCDRPVAAPAGAPPWLGTGVARRRVLQAAAGCLLPALGLARPAAGPFRIALLPDFRPEWKGMLQLLIDALRQYGRIEGRDYVFHHSGLYYGDDPHRAVRLAVDARPDLIYAANLGYVVAAHELTKTIPIVMWISGFPVEGGVATSLMRPGKNVTGLTIYAGAEVFGKLVQLLHELRPGLRRVAALHSYVPPFHPVAEYRLIAEEMREGGRRLGVDVRVLEIDRPDRITDALASAAADRAEALLLTSGVSMSARRADIVAFAIDRRLPTISDADWDPPNALLLSYGADFPALIPQSATYVDRILWHGAKPGELPIQLPAKFEMVVNPRMAKAIGMPLPQAIVARANRSIG
jgi:putative tryptophan/tyrosine transport system substrate-binding protein